VKKGKYELFDAVLHQQKRSVETRDNYVGEASNGRRVGIGNDSIRPKKLSCVVVSVGYGKYLAETLPKNIDLFDEFVVVSSTEDLETHEIARAHGAKLVLSDRCYEDDHAFNKGKMLNDGLAALKEPDWIVLTDADVIHAPQLRELFFAHSWNPGCLYFTGRFDDQPVQGQNDKVNAQPNGYFQLFHPKARAIRERWPNLMCEEFCSAGGVDSWFWQQWGWERMVAVGEFSVHHLASDSLGQNWNGVAHQPGKWRQLGVLTVHGISGFGEVTELPQVLKLTDTLYGQSVVIEVKDLDNYARVLPGGGLEFLGKALGHSHVHVAYKA